MKRVILASMVAAALALAGLSGDRTLAQTAPAKDAAPAKEAAGKDDAKAKRAAERKAKADERKAKREQAKKERAEKKAKASAERTAGRERQKQCGAEWRAAKKAGKIEKTMTWPKFWSECNTRLKAKAG
jgi:hypothetical protein